MMRPKNGIRPRSESRIELSMPLAAPLMRGIRLLVEIDYICEPIN